MWYVYILTSIWVLCMPNAGQNPPASEVNREVANLTERKNLHTPVYGAKEYTIIFYLQVNSTLLFISHDTITCIIIRPQ